MLQCFQNLIDLTKHIESENLLDTIFNSHFDYVKMLYGKLLKPFLGLK